MTDRQPDPVEGGDAPDPRAETVTPGAELPADYLRADEALLVESIELGEPHDPANTIET